MAQRIFLAARGLFIVLRRLLSCYSTQAVELAHGLSSWGTRVCRPVACGILVPRRGIELIFSALEGRFLTAGPPEKPPSVVSVSLFYLAEGAELCPAVSRAGAFSWLRLECMPGRLGETSKPLEQSSVYSAWGQTSAHACAPHKWNPGFPVSPRSPPIS